MYPLLRLTLSHREMPLNRISHAARVLHCCGLIRHTDETRTHGRWRLALTTAARAPPGSWTRGATVPAGPLSRVDRIGILAAGRSSELKILARPRSLTARPLAA